MEPAENTLISTLEFADELHKIILEEKKKLPYHLNVIDELHINENGHSRILHKLLCFKNDKDNFEFLESFVSYLQEHTHSKEFNRIKVQHPEITQEEERIDLWVRDENYAIILENKACYAQDQNEQIARYIEKTLETKNKRYKEEDIFIVYLPPTNEKEPAEQSWGKYKESFSDRYANISFKDDIIPWLEQDVLPNIRHKDVYLMSAVSQYVDYLHGIFQTRTIYNNMNMEIQSFLTKHYKLNSMTTDIQRLLFVDQELQNIHDTANSVSALRETLVKQYFVNEIKNKYPKEYCDFLDVKQQIEYAGVVLNVGNKKVVISVEGQSSTLYCQARYENNNDDLLEGSLLLEKVGNILDNHTNLRWEIWKEFRFNEYEKALSCFYEVTAACLKE